MSDHDYDKKKKKKSLSMSITYDAVLFIQEVKKRPGLYSTECSADRDLKLKLWKEIGAAMFPDWSECSKAVAYDRVLQLQLKWRSLRDAYARELRARRSGIRVNKAVYRYFKNLSFLGGFEGNLSDSTENDGAPSNTTSDPLIVIKPRPKKEVKKTRKRKERPPSSEDSMDGHETEMAVCSIDTSERETDSDKLFLLSFLPEMKQLPLQVKMWARAQIANTMQEAVASYYSNTMPGNDVLSTIKLSHDDSD